MKLEGTAARYEEVFYPQWAYSLGVELARGAFDESLKAGPEVLFLSRHAGDPHGNTLAPTEIGLLTLASDDDGLHYVVALSDQIQESVALHARVDLGLMTQASFAARILDGEYVTRDGEDVFLVSKADLDMGDISVVPFGGNSNTSSTVSALTAQDNRRTLAFNAALRRRSVYGK